MLSWLFKNKKADHFTTTTHAKKSIEEPVYFQHSPLFCTFNTKASAFEKIIFDINRSNSFASILCIPSHKGEIVYSLTIALIEAGISSHKFHIMGINRDKKIVEKAGYGAYLRDTLSKLNQDIITKYFSGESEKIHISKAIKACTSFSNIDIEAYDLERLGSFDFIITEQKENQDILKKLCKKSENILFLEKDDFSK